MPISFDTVGSLERTFSSSSGRPCPQCWGETQSTSSMPRHQGQGCQLKTGLSSGAAFREFKNHRKYFHGKFPCFDVHSLSKQAFYLQNVSDLFVALQLISLWISSQSKKHTSLLASHAQIFARYVFFWAGNVWKCQKRLAKTVSLEAKC